MNVKPDMITHANGRPLSFIAAGQVSGNAGAATLLQDLRECEVADRRLWA